MTETTPKFYLLDTNILLHEPLAFLNFEEHNVVIPMVVLEELDNIKDRHKDVSREARVAIRSLENALKDATPEEILAGVPLSKLEGAHHAQGTLAIFPDYQLKQQDAILNLSENDHRIIQSALELQQKHKHTKVVLVTKDINMRLKAKGAGVKQVEDYRTDQLIDDIRFLSKGFVEIDGDFWEHVGEVTSVQQGRDTYHEVPRETLPTVFHNQYIIDDTEHFAAKVVGYDEHFIRVHDLSYERMMGYRVWGISLRIFIKRWRLMPC